MHRSAQFRADRSNGCRDMDVCPPSCIFKKFEILTARTLRRALEPRVGWTTARKERNERRTHFGGPMCITTPNFMPIGQTVVAIWPFFVYSRWRPSAISDLLYACLDHRHRVFGGFYNCVKFGWNRCSTGSFNNMQVLIIWGLGVKMPIHAPFRCVLALLGYKWGNAKHLVVLNL